MLRCHISFKTTFEDGTRKGDMASQHQVQYASERDSNNLFTFANKGSVQNPVYTLEPARMLDPIPTMNRAMTRIVNSTYMDDYKVFAVESWLREAAPYLKATESELRYAPYA